MHESHNFFFPSPNSTLIPKLASHPLWRRWVLGYVAYAPTPRLQDTHPPTMALSILTKLLLLLPLVHLVTPLPLERRCSAETLQFPDAETISYIPEGTNLSLPFNDPSCNRPNQVVPVDICRVTLYTATSCRSGVHYEVWLPLKWKGRRFLGTGNGGIDGCKFTSI